MIFNNVINHLKLWCADKHEAYQKNYTNYGGVLYVGYSVAGELSFKLSTLIDKPFASIEDLKKEILGMIDVHYNPSVLKPVNGVAKHIIEKINREFCEYLDEVISKSDTLKPADIPYNRMIVGDEAKELIAKFRSVWGYVNTACWFPLMGEEPEEISEKFFVMFDYLEPHLKELEAILGLPQTHIYGYGESYFEPESCLETSELIEFGGGESIYTDKDFSWAIYFSHEYTVAFAGKIVPKVKKLLSAYEEHWDKFEWDWIEEK